MKFRKPGCSHAKAFSAAYVIAALFATPLGLAAETVEAAHDDVTHDTPEVSEHRGTDSDELQSPSTPQTIAELYGRSSDLAPVFAIEASVFAGLTANSESGFSNFDVPRAELGAFIRPIEYGSAELRLEAVRSAGEESLYGVDGNSLVMRIKRAQGIAHANVGPINVQLRLGIIPDAWVETLELDYSYRGLAATGAEAGVFNDTSDAGVGVVLQGPRDWLGGDAVRLSLAFSNGEGRNEVERNDGKNFSAAVSFRPVLGAFWNGEFRLGVHGAATLGTEGPGSASHDRYGVALVATHPRLEAGIEWNRAVGYLGDGDVHAGALGAWGGAEPVDGWLGVVVRYDHLNANTDEEKATRNALHVALYTDLGGRLGGVGNAMGGVRFYAGLEHVRAGDSFGPVPGVASAVDETRVMFRVAATGGALFNIGN